MTAFNEIVTASVFLWPLQPKPGFIACQSYRQVQAFTVEHDENTVQKYKNMFNETHTHYNLFRYCNFFAF